MQTLASIFCSFIWFENTILRTKSFIRLYGHLQCTTKCTLSCWLLNHLQWNCTRIRASGSSNRQSNKTFEMHTLNASLVRNQDEYVFKRVAYSNGLIGFQQQIMCQVPTVCVYAMQRIWVVTVQEVIISCEVFIVKCTLNFNSSHVYIEYLFSPVRSSDMYSMNSRMQWTINPDALMGVTKYHVCSILYVEIRSSLYRWYQLHGICKFMFCKLIVFHAILLFYK